MTETDPQSSLALAEAGDGEPRGREPWFRFALIFGTLAIASEAFYYAVALESDGFQTYLGVLARIGGAILSLFENNIVIRDTRINGNNFAIQVGQGCDAIQVCSLLAAAVIAFPIELKSKLRGLVVGILILQIFNMLRIITLYWIGSYFTLHAFEKAHHVVWPGFLITITIAIWILWVRWETEPHRTGGHAA